LLTLHRPSGLASFLSRWTATFALAIVAWPCTALTSCASTRTNFLVAGLEARRRGLYDELPADPVGLLLAGGVDAALHADLDLGPPVEQVPAREVLTVLAYAGAPGWSSQLWHTATVALGCGVSERQLDRFAPAPYRARWAAARPRTELRRLTGHAGWVYAVCPVEADGRTLLVTASARDDGTVLDGGGKRVLARDAQVRCSLTDGL
jgi:hypothetical protein